MSTSTNVRFEPLNKDNYDTWRIQMRAILIKNDAWQFVNGVKPEVVEGDATSAVAAQRWEQGDLKAQSDIILAISPAELKPVRACETARAIWTKLADIHQSRGPVRKAALLNRLISHKMQDGDDARQSTQEFMDIVDRLGEMDIEINRDLLTVMLLRSLPDSYENFRCAIASRDDLPDPEALRVKIMEEYESRKETGRNAPSQSAMVAGKFASKGKNKKKNNSPNVSQAPSSKIKCFKCHKLGHYARDCRSKRLSVEDSANKIQDMSLYATSGEKASDTAFGATANVNRDTWCIDSGCTSHVCGKVDAFSKIDSRGRGKLNLASNATTVVQAKGIARIVTNIDGREKGVNLHDTLYVPDLRTNLISVSRITNRGYTVTFSKDKAEVINDAGKVELVADRSDGLYYVRGNSSEECNAISSPEKPAGATKALSLEIWHKRLGHLNLQSLRDAIKNGAIQGAQVNNLNDDPVCEVCIEGKMTRLPFPEKSTRVSAVGDLIHSDVCGPMRVESHGKSRYFVTFIDDHSGWSEIHFLSHKNQAIEKFDIFRKRAETQQGTRVKTIQTDNGLEDVNRQFDDLLHKHGITRRLTVPYSPEQNGVAERRNRTLMETARCLLIDAGLPPSFWAEAVHTANFLRNRCPTNRLKGKTPYEGWHGRAPDVSFLRQFGSEVHILDRTPNRGKLQPRSKRGILVGYSDESKGYRVWLPGEKRVEISRDVRFIDASRSRVTRGPVEPSSASDTLADAIQGFEINGDADQSTDILIDLHRQENQFGSENTSDAQTLARQPPKRGRGRPRKVMTGQRGRPRKTYHAAHEEDGARVESESADRDGRASDSRHVDNNGDVNDGEHANTAFLTEVPIGAALSSPESDDWMQAMASEVKSVLQNDTWEIVNRPEGHNVIGSRFILRNKLGSDGQLERRKARIIARGFSQRPGLDFQETYAPVARLSTIRLGIAMAARKRMYVRQYDVTTAYLNGVLEEKVYMEVPGMLEEVLQYMTASNQLDLGLSTKAKLTLQRLKSGDMVCRMERAIYGLKQAGRARHS